MLIYGSYKSITAETNVLLQSAVTKLHAEINSLVEKAKKYHKYDTSRSVRYTHTAPINV
jgi:deoxycytidylate deaminase